MRITIYVSGTKEQCIAAGEKAGLSGEALRLFGFAATEHELVYDVDERTGSADVIEIDGRKIAKD